MGREYCIHMVRLDDDCEECDVETELAEQDYWGRARAWHAFREWCGPSRACVWTQSEYNLWETDCNGAFEVNDGGPYDNDMRFCCYCGGALIERPYEDAEDDSDD